MKRVVLLTSLLILAVSCKPQKPWSPYDGKNGNSPIVADSKAGSSFTKNEQFDADIGDVEQAVFIKGQLTPDSTAPNVVVADTEDARDRILISNVTIYQPVPESLWLKYTVECSRNFMLYPAVVRAEVMVDDKVAGTFSVVLGQTAIKNGVSAKVDLFKPFQGQVPDSFLVKISGDMYLMPQGTEEAKVNPDTATSQSHSKAIQATAIRVTVKRNETAPPPAATDAPAADAANATPAPAPAPAPTPAGPDPNAAPATVTPETAQPAPAPSSDATAPVDATTPPAPAK